jgi:hypothetical protein
MNNMKKIVVVLIFLISVILPSCTTDTSGYKSELVSRKWIAELSGGATVNLEFAENIAKLEMRNADKKVEIKGRYVADDETFVIFVPEISQNYSFTYLPKGEKLDVSYNGYTITLENHNKY